MLISHRYRFIYVKTVKTAGTSVEVALEPLCLPPGLVRDGAGEGAGGDPAVESEAGIIGARGPAAATEGERWRNHMSAAEIRANLPPEIWQGYTKFCNIRNPWDKTVSWFHFQFREIKHRPPQEIYAAFRDWMRGNPALGQDTGIYMIDGKPAMDDYIRYDNLDADLARIGDRLGFAIDALPRLKSAQRGSRRLPYQDYYDDAARATVARLYARPIEVFGWTFD